MANENIIPKRPSNDSEFTAIKANDRDCLSYAVAFNVPNERAFSLFHPEFLDESGKLTKVGKKQSQQFFSYAKNKEYVDAYRQTLVEHFGIGAKSNNDGGNADISDDRIDNSFKSFLLQAIEDIEKGKVVDNETFKLYMELFKKLGRFKDDVDVQEAPRRYLPARCHSECAYRLFVESHVEGGEIINECDFCRTRKFAEENGWQFDPTKNLDLPIENNQ